jgi:cytoskeletal protein RodZ
MARVGEILLEERSRQGISLSAVANRTRIRQAFLKALEEGDFESLPQVGHTVGFAISYAQFLGLDSGALAAQLRKEMNPGSPEGRGAFDRARDTNRTSTDTHEIPWKVVWNLVGVVVLVGGLIWLLTTFVFSSTPSSTSPLGGNSSTESTTSADGAAEATATTQGGR